MPARASVSGIWSVTPSNETFPTDNVDVAFGMTIKPSGELLGLWLLLLLWCDLDELLATLADDAGAAADELAGATLLLDSSAEAAGLILSPRTSIIFSA